MNYLSAINPTGMELNMTAAHQANTLNTSMDLGLDSLDFFNDLPNLPQGDVDDLDFAGVDFLLNLDNDIMDENTNLTCK